MRMLVGKLNKLDNITENIKELENKIKSNQTEKIPKILTERINKDSINIYLPQSLLNQEIKLIISH